MFNHSRDRIRYYRIVTNVCVYYASKLTFEMPIIYYISIVLHCLENRACEHKFKANFDLLMLELEFLS